MTHDGTDDDVTENTWQALVVDLVGSGRDVLDVGSGDASLARALAARGCRVAALVDAATEPASVESLDVAVVVDVASARLGDHFTAGQFDVVVLPHVLHHVPDPDALLREAAALLREGGRVVSVVDNVAHGSTRLALLQGRWAGQDGRGGAHQFTERSLLALLGGAGLKADAVRSTVADPLATETSIDDALVLPRVIEWVRHQPTALDRELVVSAHPHGPDEGGPAPRLEPALPYESVRVRDRYTEQMERDQAARHDLLTMRDHIIGLEASVAAARAREADARGRLRAATKQLREARAAARRDRQAPVAADSSGGWGARLRRLGGRSRR